MPTPQSPHQPCLFLGKQGYCASLLCLCVREACHVTVVHSKPPFMHVITNRPVGPLRHPAALLPPLRLHFHPPLPDAPPLPTHFSSIVFPFHLFNVCPSPGFNQDTFALHSTLSISFIAALFFCFINLGYIGLKLHDCEW